VTKECEFDLPTPNSLRSVQLGVDLCVCLAVVRAAVRLPGGKEAGREGIAGCNLVSLIMKIWPIALSCEFAKKGRKIKIELKGESLLEVLLGVLMNFVKGDIESKKALCGGERAERGGG